MKSKYVFFQIVSFSKVINIFIFYILHNSLYISSKISLPFYLRARKME